MSYVNVTADNVNKVIQFEVKDNCQSISLQFNPEITPALLGDTNVLVTLVMKNKPEQVLINSKFSSIKDVLKHFIPSLNSMIPVSFATNLVLNADAYIRVTLTWTHAIPVTVFQYSLNTTLFDEKIPLIIKEIAIDGEVEVDTEYYPLVLVDPSITSMETIVMIEGEDDVLRPQKVFMNSSLMQSQLEVNETYVCLATEPNQKLKFVGTGKKVFLMQIN